MENSPTISRIYFLVTKMVLTGSVMKLGQSSVPTHQVLKLIAGINYGRPVIDTSLTPLHKLCSQAMGCTVILAIFGKVTGSLVWDSPKRPTIFDLQGSTSTLEINPKHH